MMVLTLFALQGRGSYVLCFRSLGPKVPARSCSRVERRRCAQSWRNRDEPMLQECKLTLLLIFLTTFLTLCMIRITLPRPSRSTPVTSQVVINKEATGTAASRNTVALLRSLNLESDMHPVEGMQVGWSTTNRMVGTAVKLKGTKVDKATATKVRTEAKDQATVTRVQATTIKALAMGAMVSHKVTPVATANKEDTEGTECISLFCTCQLLVPHGTSSGHLHACLGLLTLLLLSRFQNGLHVSLLSDLLC